LENANRENERELQKLKSSHEKALSVSSSALETSKLNLTEFERKYSDISWKLKNSQFQHAREIETSTIQVSELTEKNKILSANLKLTEGLIEKGIKELSTSKALITDQELLLKEALNNNQTKESKLIQDLELTSKQLESKLERIRNLEREISKIQSKLSEADHELNLSKSNQRTLSDKFMQLQATMNELSIENHDIKTERTRLQKIAQTKDEEIIRRDNDFALETAHVKDNTHREMQRVLNQEQKRMRDNFEEKNGEIRIKYENMLNMAYNQRQKLEERLDDADRCLGSERQRAHEYSIKTIEREKKLVEDIKRKVNY
jgi:chromosome segregation ATPase